MRIELNAPAGPVANAYEQSRARVAFILGPTGGGKTTASIKRILRVAQWQDPSPRDGVRKARIVCVGPTYRRLWDTAIPSYREAMSKMGLLKLPKDPNFTGSTGDPCNHIFDIRSAGHGMLHIEVLFRAVQDLQLEDFVRGFQCTAWWNPEADTLPEDLIQLELNRVGRYPEPDDRPAGQTEATYAGVFGDANVPDIDSWFYNMFWLSGNRPKEWLLFRQPSGLSPHAENLHNLKKINPRYYEQMVADETANKGKWAVRRFVECKPGYSRHGQPVHDNFDDEVHVAAGRLEVDPYAPVIIGVDGGSSTNLPGATFQQRDYGGNWKVLADFAPTTATTIEELGQRIRFILNGRIRRSAGAVIFIDPAAVAKSPFGPTYAQLLQHHAGVEVRFAPSQKPQERRGAVKKILDRRGGCLIDPSCTDLIKALAGGFRFLKLAQNKGALTIEKNLSSHVAEAFEYGILGGDGQDGFANGLIGPEGEADDAKLFLQPILA